MPTISMFYGIIIRMYFGPGEHPPPHFHAVYAEHEMLVNIETGKVWKGKLPPKQTQLTLAWAALHKDELMANWQLAMDGEQLYGIQPLK